MAVVDSFPDKKKLLYLADYFYPHWTGICKSSYYLVKLLHHKIDFTVLTVRFDKNLKKREPLFSGNIIRENYLFTLSRVKYSLSIIFRLLRIINNYDIVLINSPFSNILPAAVIAKLNRKRLIILHQADFILPRGVLNKLLEIVYFTLSVMAFSLADVVSTWNYDYAQSSAVLKPFLYKFHALPMVISLPHPLKKTDKDFQKLENLKKKGIFLVGFAGRFVEEKGFDLLLQAIPVIIRSNPQIYFVYAGQTNIEYEKFFQKNYQQYLKVKDRIINLGLLKDNLLVRFYKTVDLIVVPSRTDAFPLVQAEAVFAGTPAVTSDIPGARHLIKATGFGILFEKENIADLSRKIIYACTNINKFKKRYKNVLEFFDNAENQRRIYRFFTS